ncbi:gastrula zinc finger protein XlCGF57.1-like [Dunckerocampus dactyliophorus]|uniref:gastrula zinc finger protein XlCGF57.1-like n=1 Tax=Dunckerocampus dactyliophorus TaxID=161453 RepID=UPI002405025B|nr:gastrula zinc finger protein XlCGF57.1-like [Dunckerocampus dactyliophorus]
MCKVQMLRALMEQRLNAAVEDIFRLIERTIAEYEEELSRTKEEKERQREQLDAALKDNVGLHRADIQQVLVESKEEVPSEQQEWSSSLGQKQPEPPRIKEEEEQFKGLKEVDITTFPLTGVLVKGEGSEAQSSERHYGQGEDNRGTEAPTPSMTAEADGEHCEGSQADSNLAPVSDMNDMMSHSSETDDKDSKGEMRPHVDSKHFNCSECERTFNRKESLKRHMAMHTGERPFTCSVCARSFSLRQYLERHTMIHKGETPFSCSVCPKRFRDKFKLMVHMRKHTGEKYFTFSSSTQHVTTEGNGEHCRESHADGSFAPLSVNDMMSHSSETDHSDEELQPLQSNKDSKGDMRHHTDDKLLNCSQCAKTFDKRWKWKRHMKCHTAKKPFSCSICAKGFIQKSDMTIHMAVHTGEKPFTCVICAKSFAAKKYMAIHMRTHTGERPYACSVCAKRFTTKPQMDRHMMRIHPFSCTMCKK